MANAITTARQMVFEMASSAMSWPIFQFLPQSADDLPCIVVGRPDVDEGDERALLAISVPLYVLGRTSTARDDSAQAELDGVADQVLNAFWKPQQPTGFSLRLSRIRATVVPVAANEIPAYTALIALSTVYC